MNHLTVDRRTTALTSARWERVAALFEEALARPAAERDDFVLARCHDPQLAAEVHALLTAFTTAPGPLERVMAAVAPAEPWHAAAPRLHAGPYELLRELGRGGMGVVYLARRADGEYQRIVALKLARAPVLDATLRSRFLAERDILAGLTHPHIAPLFDGGVTDDGLPYFTMEYVDGLPIDVYCDAHALDIHARIRLFLDICGAVAAAHRALVVHRDLKPNNVLVTAAGTVKLVDFGIAKLLAPAAMDDTADDARVMTPAYASPEQVRGQSVSTATDVYALGLLLYELLCGRRAHRLPGRGAADLERAVLNEDPLPMSLALTCPEAGDTSAADAIARRRQSTVRRLCRQLRGDLDRIATMALQKDPDRRYATAAQMAEDLQRYLDGRPVVARGHSLPYRVTRFVRRHRLALLAVTLLSVTLAGYVALAVRHARDMERAAAREREDAARAREVADFMVGLLEASDPGVVQQRDMPVVQVLEQGLRRADALSAQPLLQARMLNAIGRVYFSLGRYPEAERVATRALAISLGAGGERHPDVARDQRLLGLAIGALGRQRDAADRFRAALEIRRATDGPQSAEYATDQHHLGYALAQSGQLEEAERHLTASLTLRRAVLPPGHEDIALSVSGLAFVRNRQGRPGEAVALYREALALRLARLGERHPEVARARQNLASSLTTAGEFDEAARELSRALDGYRAVYGEKHPSIATTLNNLGTLEARRRRDRDAVRYFSAALELRRELMGRDHPSTLLAQGNLASLLGRVGRAAEGEAMLREVLALTSDHDDVAMGISRPQSMANLAHLLLLQGKLRGAEATARDAVALAATRRVSPLTEASVLATLGKVLGARGRHAEAADLLRRALDIRRERLGAAHPDVVRTQKELEAVVHPRR
jgi:serine/threonine-protein kinase